MATSGTSSQGATISMQSGTTYNAIAQIEGFTGPGVSTDLIDVTNLDSSGGFKEYVAGLKDGGTFSFDIVWKSTDTATLQAQQANFAGTLCGFKTAYPFSTPVVYTYSGYVTKWEPKAAKGDVMRASMEIKVTGAITVS